MMDESQREYRISTRSFSGVIFCLFLIFVWLMWFYRPDQLKLQDRIAVLLLVFMPLLLVLWSMNRSSVLITSQKLVLTGLFLRKIIEWEKVEDFAVSDKLILIRDSKGQEIKLFHAEFGSFEPFEELKTEMYRCISQNKSLWGTQFDHIVVPYPRLSGLTLIGYSIPLLVIGLLLGSIVTRFGGSPGFMLVGLLGTVFIMLPLFLRDISTTRNRLLVNPEGLILEAPRKRTSIKWKDVGGIIIKEPVTVGYGKIVVKSKVEGSEIAIPRSIKNFGRIYSLLQSKTGIVPRQTFDY
jgi:hypothetical protein